MGPGGRRAGSREPRTEARGRRTRGRAQSSARYAPRRILRRFPKFWGVRREPSPTLGVGGSVFPPGLKSAAVALGQRLCWGDRSSCAEAPAYPARYWAPLGSRAGPPSAQSWGPGSGRLAGRFCSHFWTCFSGRTHHFYIEVNWWRRKWQPTPVFLPRESCGRRSLVGCCPWGRTESDTTEET